MPHRLASLAILLSWALAATALLIRDVLPNWIVGPPPNMRSVVLADERPTRTRWIIQAADDFTATSFRAVGRAETVSMRLNDGTVKLSSSASFDTGKLLQGTLFKEIRGEQIEVVGVCEVDATGNLERFHAGVRDGPPPRAELLSFDGRLVDDQVEVHAKGFLPMMNWSKRFPYPPRGMVQDAMGPLDRMPNLHVGQRWESRVISPLTGKVEVCRVEVRRRETIVWNDQVVPALEVVTHTSPVSVTTWVHPDTGLVFKQEVPFPLVRLVLERLPDLEESDGSLPKR